MKTKLLFIVICSLLSINLYGQTYQKSINTNSQQHYHDLNVQAINDGGTDFAVAGNIFDSTIQNYSPVLKRVDELGNIIWINNYSSSLPNARVFDISYYKDTGVSFIAMTGSIDVGTTKRTFIATIDAGSGALVSQQYYTIISPDVNSRGLHIITTNTDVDGDGIADPGFVVGGFFSDSYNVNTNANNIGFVIRVYVTLGLFWTIEVDSSSNNADYDMVNHITETDDGFFLTGSTNQISTGQQVVLAHKIDFQGNFLWDQSYVYGNSQDISVDAYFDAASQNIYMLSNYSASHFFGITSLNNLTGTINLAETWVGTANEVDRYGFTIIESRNDPNNLIITGYDRDVTWIDSSSNTLTGQSNLFVYEFDKATGNQVGTDNYQYLVQHLEPIGDEFNFWNGQLPLIYYPDISFHNLSAEAIPYYYHIGYKTDTTINLTEADLFKTETNKINDCDKEPLSINPAPIAIVNVDVISGETPNSANPIVLTSNSISPITTDCNPTLSLGNNFNKDNIRIYPNPAKDKVNIEIVNYENLDIEYKIYNILGKLILQGKTTKTIDIKYLSKGVFIIEIKLDYNKYHKKLIIK